MAKFFLALSVLFNAVAAQDGGMALFDWDCASGKGSIQSCNNACYVVNCVAGFSDTTVYYLARPQTDAHRTESGARPSPDPCKDNWSGSKQWRQAGDRTAGGAPATSPDEFPWASVANGGNGARLRCVNLQDNTSGGTKLRNFYQRQPGWKNDQAGDNTISRSFQVTISNSAGAAYCDPNPDCTNDGGEFVLQSRNPRVYVDGKRDLETQSFSDSETPSEPLYRMRRYMSSDGVVRQLLGRDNGTLPHTMEGKEVLKEDGSKAKLMYQITD